MKKVLSFVLAALMLTMSFVSCNKTGGETVTTADVTTATPTEAPAPVEEAPAAASDDSELIAVLAAAISAYCGEPVTKFRVVSFKHIK
jgi:hypothetical protein